MSLQGSFSVNTFNFPFKLNHLFLYFFFTLLLCITFYNSEADGSVLTIPFSVSKPTFQNSTLINKVKPNSLLSKYQGTPLPTNSFWTNLILGDGTSRIAVYPYQIAVLPDSGLAISFPKLTVNKGYILTAFIKDFSLETAEDLNSRKVSAFDLVSVTLNWDNGALETPLVQGSVYVTGIYKNKTPAFTTVRAITGVNGQSGSRFTGTVFSVTLNNDQNWIIYSSSPITLEKTASRLQATAPFTGYIRVALCTSSAMRSVLDAGKGVYPTGGEVSYSLPTSNEAIIQFLWKTDGQSSYDNLLMAALPHHMDTLITPTVALRNAFQTLKGSLSIISGGIWNMKEPLTTTNWNAPKAIPENKKADIAAALEADKNVKTSASDPYFFGKEIARNGRLALIADQLGKTDVASGIRFNMKSALNKWLNGENTNSLLYDTVWGGICSKRGLNNTEADFGNGVYNDHHFHYGYHIYAAAAIAKEDPEWAAAYGEKVMNLVRDIANPNRRDPYFTVTRNKDWFSGHSWASGVTVFGDSKNQESTSESINAYYAIHLWGLAIGNAEVSNLGRVMLATEIRATKKYWQMTSDSSVYPSPFSDNKVVGILWSSKVDYATWFGSNVEFIHCIQMLPFTPISEAHLPAKWIREEYPIVKTALTRQTPALSEGWKGFIYMAHAIIDPAEGWNEVKTLRSYDEGNSKTNTLYWAATRP